MHHYYCHISLNYRHYLRHCRHDYRHIIAIYAKMQKLMGPKLTQAEGFVLGVGAKIFTISGPVILYGTAAGTVYGVIYWVFKIVSGG